MITHNQLSRADIFSDCQEILDLETDNAAIEAINDWMKAEMFDDFHITSNENIEREIADYIVFYNEERPAYFLNYLTPKQYREYYAH